MALSIVYVNVFETFSRAFVIVWRYALLCFSIILNISCVVYVETEFGHAC